MTLAQEGRYENLRIAMLADGLVTVEFHRPQVRNALNLAMVRELQDVLGALAQVADLRQGVHWVSWGGRDPLHEYLTAVDRMYQQMEDELESAIVERLEEVREGRVDPTDRGATWTYLTTDQPFGTWTERVLRGLRRKAQTGKFFG